MTEEDREARDDGPLEPDSDGYQPGSTADIGSDSDCYPSATPLDAELDEFDEGLRPLIKQSEHLRQAQEAAETRE